MAEALRTTYWVPQMGSKFAKSACGTKRSARAAARCEIAGVGKEPAADRAPAAAADFKNALRSMVGPLCGLHCRLAGKFRAELRLVAIKIERRAIGRHRHRPFSNVREVAPPRKRWSGCPCASFHDKGK